MPSRIPEGTPPRVLIRDFLIFQAKTFIDGIKDIVVIPFATILFALDLIFGKGDKRGRTFYALMGACESFDRWMNLYKPASQARGSAEGLFAGSEPGDGSMVGDIEGFVQRHAARRTASAAQSGMQTTR